MERFGTRTRQLTPAVILKICFKNQPVWRGPHEEEPLREKSGGAGCVRCSDYGIAPYQRRFTEESIGRVRRCTHNGAEDILDRAWT